jgi:hypothetical protein
MASVPSRLPEQFQPVLVPDFNISEFAADSAGPLSPFGSDVEFPLPVDTIRYTHPAPADRPNLADGR